MVFFNFSCSAILDDYKGVEPIPMSGEIMVYFNYSCSAILDDYGIGELGVEIMVFLNYSCSAIFDD